MLGRRRARRWLDGWEVVADGLPQWALLDDVERVRAGALVERFVRSWRWEAARGFELTQEAVVTVAASGAVLGLGMDVAVWRHVRAVVLHPRTFVQRTVRATGVRGVVAAGPQHLHGHAQDATGPVSLAWSTVRRDVHAPARGRHVVVHELAHKLDAADGLFDGTPALGRAEREAFRRILGREYRRLRRRPDADPVLRRYGAQSPTEFFAVAVEAFIQRPLDLEAHHPDLYDVLRGTFGQDPAERARRS